MAAYRESNPRHYLIIFGILVVFCLLFLILFRIDSSKISNNIKGTELNLFQMVPDSRTRNTAVKEQARKDGLDLREIAARDSFDDPTLMAFPNKKYGFSTVREENNEPPSPEIGGYNLPVIKVDDPQSERVPLVGIYPDPDGSDPGNFKAPEVDRVNIPELNKAYSARIVWLENGVEKGSPLKIEDVKKAAAGKIPESVTEIKIEKLSSSPVQFLVKKSGVPALDQLVMHYLRDLFTKVFTGDLQAKELPDTILVDWRLILRDDKSP